MMSSVPTYIVDPPASGPEDLPYEDVVAAWEKTAYRAPRSELSTPTTTVSCERTNIVNEALYVYDHSPK